MHRYNQKEDHESMSKTVCLCVGVGVGECLKISCVQVEG